MDFDIVPYEAEQLPAILRIAEEAWAPVFESIRASLEPQMYDVFYPEGWRAHHLRDVEAVCKDEEIPVWVARAAGAAIGFLGLRLHQKTKMGEIYIIGVDPDSQGKGVGSRLSRFAIEEMRKAGMTSAMVETGGDPGHAPARRAYEQAGFKLWPVARYFLPL